MEYGNMEQRISESREKYSKMRFQITKEQVSELDNIFLKLWNEWNIEKTFDKFTFKERVKYGNYLILNVPDWINVCMQCKNLNLNNSHTINIGRNPIMCAIDVYKRKHFLFNDFYLAFNKINETIKYEFIPVFTRNIYDWMRHDMHDTREFEEVSETEFEEEEMSEVDLEALIQWERQIGI